ncbi:hypothetical protein COS21_01655 [bacterium (Candidatus Gribaldobacteria) CG02_land_8_20_14_3_00_41_15]|uniref:Uncharacterized protein n=2 Tax=Candidatus Gribaldobacteria TaxID=2798536 RepID=A0A2H0UYB1_9BACT|nr:MAG: hypothetical protein AUJ36_00665 [Parcubacteria group bacterium CG1_02_41_26]PIR91199.1 MAG: hypothetical protein COU03_02765 [bacterium (Candidatus Gribaldobacteria) CG10_big_fil_rev_8_21_14_0_10_41_12]PIV47120.1 MAG: hypothetical protein COS21_01655 [bacterium (Candidatus Gribaldobacteria) CG02_land_8_20_14_3_00_41_15]
MSGYDGAGYLEIFIPKNKKITKGGDENEMVDRDFLFFICSGRCNFSSRAIRGCHRFSGVRPGGFCRFRDFFS